MSAHVQGSDEWHAIRAGMVKASTCAAFEREHKYLSPAQLLRAEVRALTHTRTEQDVPSEFVSTPATRNGSEKEGIAVPFYARHTGTVVESTGSVAHPEYSFLRSSPDGLIGLVGGLEVKCPYNTDRTYSVWDENKRMYLWQVRATMEVFDLEWMDFLCYISPDIFHIDRVERQYGWLEEEVSGKYLPNPQAKSVRRIDLWHAWFNHIQNEFQDAELRAAHIAPLKPDPKFVNNDDDLDALDTAQRRISFLESGIADTTDEISALKKDCDKLKNVLAERYNRTITNNHWTVEVVEKTPPIDWKQVAEHLGGEEAILASGESMENFRRKNNRRQISIKQNKEQQ
tara:strand:- start:529 stop:1557 length:1029 start_codon:yes stop_codon:yes gene_type:complete